MIIHILFGQRKEQYEGQYAPEVLVAWDEFCIDENPDGWTKATEKAKTDEYSKEFVAFRIVRVAVNGHEIRNLLLASVPVIRGQIQDP